MVQVKPYQGKRLDMQVYHPEEYRDTRGYCTGDDALSRQLVEGAQWERWNTETLIKRNIFNSGVVIDVGAHIGWFSLVAATKGCTVIAFEGDPENAQLLENNVHRNGFDDQIAVNVEWIDEGWEPDLPDVEDLTLPIDLIKVDLEGKDAYAIEGLWKYVGHAKHLLVEISPVFSDGYPELVERICEQGYRAEIMGQEIFPLPDYEWIEGCHQVDMLFSRENQ